MEVERLWTGAAPAVRECVRLARERGQLVDEQWFPAEPGWAAVRVVLRDQALPAGPERVSVPWRSVAAGTAIVGGAVATGAAVWWAATAAVGWLAAHVEHILGVLAVVLAVWWLLGRAGACPGIHCPGCGCS